MSDPRAGRSDALVLFGATGDLAYKKIFPSVYALAASGRLGVPVIGVASSEGDDAWLRDRARASIAEHVADADPAVVDDLVASISYVSGDYRERSVFDLLATALDGCARPLYYLAIPPTLFDDVIEGVAGIGCSAGGRVVVEKPFGRDAESAADLNAVLHRAFPEEAVFRIDHYLGKESVENLLVIHDPFTFNQQLIDWNNHRGHALAD